MIVILSMGTVPILKEVLIAHVTLDMVVMELTVQVSIPSNYASYQGLTNSF